MTGSTTALALVAATMSGAIAVAVTRAQTPPTDRHAGWVAETGYAIAVDAEGFSLPTAIAFVPQPGPAPADPLYFVAELRGTVKVVTNDRSVHVFAHQFFQLETAGELPAVQGQVGLAGLCLDAEHGYVFVTFAHQDSTGVLRNNVARFSAAPGTFSLSGSDVVDFSHVFAGAESAISHQIGGCQVVDGELYVSVADALQPARSQDTTSVLGKILRLTLDGEAVPTNRFYRNPEGRSPLERSSSYIWAYGFRNPFGLEAVGDALYVAENGDNIDRFVRVHAGENYLWDGTDLSIGARADLVFSPAIGPVHIERVPDDAVGAAFDGLRGDFFTAASAEARPGIVRIPYSLDDRRVTAPPRFLVRYEGPGLQIAAGVAVGPDGLYFAPVLPDADGRTAVLRVHAAPGLARSGPRDALAIMESYGCLGCHRLGVEGGSVGPRLDRDSLRARLVQQHNADSREEQLEWTAAKIVDPQFDNPAAEMPRLDVSPDDAAVIAAFLVGSDQTRSLADVPARIVQALTNRIPRPVRLEHFVVIAAAGFAAGALLTGAVALFVILLRRRRSSRAV